MKKKRVIEINIWDDITMEYISSIRPGEEELGLIIKGHLLIENILNQIIEIKFKNSKLLFDDNRTNSFSVKLNILYSLGFIPKYIFQNITNINKIRAVMEAIVSNVNEIDNYLKFNKDGKKIIDIKKLKSDMTRVANVLASLTSKVKSADNKPSQGQKDLFADYKDQYRKMLTSWYKIQNKLPPKM